jgi:hypothetical protein
MIVNPVRPRAEIHDLTGSGAPRMLLFPLEFVGGALVIGRLLPAAAAPRSRPRTAI